MAKLFKPRPGGMGMGGSFGSRSGGSRHSVPRKRPSGGSFGNNSGFGRSANSFGGFGNSFGGPSRGGGMGGAFLGSMLAGMLNSNSSGLDHMARALGQSLAGAEEDLPAAQPQDGQPIETVAPGYPVECENCGATIAAYEWTCQYCDGPRPREKDKQ